MTRIYGKAENKTDIRNINSKIRKDVRKARTRSRLTELYNRSKYLITLTYSPALKGKGLRSVAKEEFRKTTSLINRRARMIGTSANYDTMWG